MKRTAVWLRGEKQARENLGQKQARHQTQPGARKSLCDAPRLGETLHRTLHLARGWLERKDVPTDRELCGGAGAPRKSPHRLGKGRSLWQAPRRAGSHLGKTHRPTDVGGLFLTFFSLLGRLECVGTP